MADASADPRTGALAEASRHWVLRLPRSAGQRPNGAALSAFRYHVTCLWRRSLRRRSQKDASTWQRVGKLADDWLPKPKILHPWPHQRFAVKYPRWEPYAGVPHV